MADSTGTQLTVTQSELGIMTQVSIFKKDNSCTLQTASFFINQLASLLGTWTAHESLPSLLPTAKRLSKRLSTALACGYKH